MRHIARDSAQVERHARCAVLIHHDRRRPAAEFRADRAEILQVRLSARARDDQRSAAERQPRGGGEHRSIAARRRGLAIVERERAGVDRRGAGITAGGADRKAACSRDGEARGAGDWAIDNQRPGSARGDRDRRARCRAQGHAAGSHGERVRALPGEVSGPRFRRGARKRHGRAVCIVERGLRRS